MQNASIKLALQMSRKDRRWLVSLKILPGANAGNLSSMIFGRRMFEPFAVLTLWLLAFLASSSLLEICLQKKLMKSLAKKYSAKILLSAYIFSSLLAASSTAKLMTRMAEEPALVISSPEIETTLKPHEE